MRRRRLPSSARFLRERREPLRQECKAPAGFIGAKNDQRNTAFGIGHRVGGGGLEFATRLDDKYGRKQRPNVSLIERSRGEDTKVMGWTTPASKIATLEDKCPGARRYAFVVPAPMGFCDARPLGTGQGHHDLESRHRSHDI
jgi:hypothetical protein